MSEPLELQIEEVWLALTKMPQKRRRTLYLTTGRRVVWSSNDIRASHLLEIGTYCRSVKLSDLREDVFFANEQMRDAA